MGLSDAKAFEQSAKTKIVVMNLFIDSVFLSKKELYK